MRVLVDCVPILVGGGVQAAVAVLAGLRDRPDHLFLRLTRTERAASSYVRVDVANSRFFGIREWLHRGALSLDWDSN